jgi:hypothetical protein
MGRNPEMKATTGKKAQKECKELQPTASFRI